MATSETTAETSEPTWVGEVLDFWFKEIGASRWFVKNADLDSEIRNRFLALYERLVAGELQDFPTPRVALAAVIALDQFPRNMFRDSARAFAGDPMARHIAREAIDRGYDAGLKGEERLFLYLPFEHSEDLEDQVLSCELIGSIGNDYWTKYARAHKEIIDRFGRFPHRNAVLGRTSTRAEIELLKDPMGSF
ncbi:MAG: DUF924 domain-containing protein [Steroidobacteraceae bacterium]|nr:DUF924 domain-containing protein [Steroidobacteraceae bacterium]